MREFQIGDKSYRTGQLDAFSQIHLGLKVGPVLQEGISRIDGDLLPTKTIMEILAKVPREDIDFILRTALGCVSRKEGDAWALIYNAGAARMAYQDISAVDMIRIASEVLQEYIIPFFEGLVRLASGSETSTNAS